MTDQTNGPRSSSWLSDLLGALLIDLARAQHLSNEYSKRLGEIYKIDPLLRVFPVPNGYLTEVTVDLQMAIDDVLASDGLPEAGQVHVMRVLARYVNSIVEACAPLAVEQLRANMEAFSPSAKAVRMADALLAPSWQRALCQEIVNRIAPDASEIAAPDGTLHRERGLAILTAAVQQAFAHPDYAALPEGARSRLREQIAAVVQNKASVEDLQKQLRERSASPQPMVRVTASSDVLGALNAGAFGKIAVHASVRDFLVQAVPMPDTSGANAPPIQEFKLVPAKH